ncbi:MAG TPA: helix-turn-helix domain-containing protein [Candidatus Limnocylindria bacterium]|jgi:excisionase family DNA binding protein|nr:helix-turn-helix domain-containing protein [Candidatus Limnocylindria bacterium]
MLSPLVSVETACDYLTIKKTKFYGLVKRGLIETVKFGKTRLVPEHALADFVRANTESAGSSRVRR